MYWASQYNLASLQSVKSEKTIYPEPNMWVVVLLQFVLRRISECLVTWSTLVSVKIMPVVMEIAKRNILTNARAFLATIDASARMASELEELQVRPYRYSCNHACAALFQCCLKFVQITESVQSSTCPVYQFFCVLGLLHTTGAPFAPAMLSGDVSTLQFVLQCDTIVVDEAACVPEYAIPQLLSLRPKNLVVLGDHKQVSKLRWKV